MKLSSFSVNNYRSITTAREIQTHNMTVLVGKNNEGNQKWSDRVKNCFLSQGKQWSDAVEKKVKLVVANTLPNDPVAALDQHKRSSIDALVHALEILVAQ